MKKFNKKGIILYFDQLKQWIINEKNGNEPDLGDFVALNKDLSIRKRGWLLVNGPFYKIFPTKKKAESAMKAILAFNIRTI